MQHPVLYSLQNCPYAIRARMGLLLAQQAVTVRAIEMKNKPAEMLTVSPKGTVPVLVLTDESVIDESLDIMLWALRKNDPSNLLYRENPSAFPAMLTLINSSDNKFTNALSKYKHAVRYHETSEVYYRRQCEIFIIELEQRLAAHDYLMGMTPSLADYAIMPFIRQFARVDRKWYLQAPYPHLRRWLDAHLQSQLFSQTMTDYPLWLDSQETCQLG